MNTAQRAFVIPCTSDQPWYQPNRTPRVPAFICHEQKMGGGGRIYYWYKKTEGGKGKKCYAHKIIMVDVGMCGTINFKNMRCVDSSSHIIDEKG